MKNRNIFILLIMVLIIGSFGACTRQGAQKPINNPPVRDPQMRSTPENVLPNGNNDREGRITEKINNISEVEDARVIINGSDAYVAVRLKNGVNNSTRVNLLETEIRNMVKKESPRIANVYFSAAEGTLGKLRGYRRDDIRNGTVIDEIESLFRSPMKNMTMPAPNR
ncbi:MAG: YhcN/YlaJ family sporulation lipoprotein [Anaeromicrobium sp.]|uniref:YhcN/YlaJ family sporulation lipoprotein n=1 Tax=Anaeromicrobium sp. TaxID=1929132 RepID=UPI0025E64E2F|nr:YhcN/YlaJ family sporulation lipoprotein [Anaeromicrobium sp.]MCT4593754.1 YhcN/YlaJ family sporulation lipoprotein [Anaeromicrobium sp.]